MTSNKFTLPFQRSANVFELVLVPFCGLLVLMAIDTYYVLDAFILPFLLVLVLGYLALRLPWWAVLTWALLYAGVILTLLLCKAKETFTFPEFAPYMRAATFLSCGVVAAVLAHHRTQLEKSYNALFKVLGDMPQPMIVSDVSGTILLVNREAGKLMDLQGNTLSGLSFFSTFAPLEGQGEAISKYISYFNAETASPFKIRLHPRGDVRRALEASLSVVWTPSQRIAVTVIENFAEPSPS